MPAPTLSPDAERLFELGRFDEALTAWQAIAAIDPLAVRARGRVAACLVGLGRHGEAAAILEPLVDEHPGQLLLQYRLAVARAGLGDYSAALDALDAAASAGLRLRSGLDTEPAFAALRDLVRYPAIRDRIARNDAPTASEAGFRTFDFWVGSWEARTEDGVLQGHNRIEPVLGGAAIVERWTGVTGFQGTSLNRYDRRTGTWRQTWVDDQGDIVEFENGVATDGRVVFTASDADGGLRRLTFEDRGSDAFRQVSEQSADGGRTWTIEYDFRYRRLGGSEGVARAGPVGPEDNASGPEHPAGPIRS